MDSEARRTIEQMSAHAQQIAGKLQDLTARGSDDRSMVTATCGPGGRLVDITFKPKSRRLDTYELREVVLAAVERAAQAAQEQFAGVLGELTGSADRLGTDVTARANEQIAQYQRVVEEQQQRLREIRDSQGRQR
jgi:DNA-binding protein YbaB